MKIEIERQDDGSYHAWRTHTHGDHLTYDNIPTSRISKPIPYGKSVEKWANDLSWDELEAAILIFTDRWTWDSGTEEDRICLEALEAEWKWRGDENGHNHVFTSHTPPANPVDGQMYFDTMSGQFKVFTQCAWHPISGPPTSHTHTFFSSPTKTTP